MSRERDLFIESNFSAALADGRIQVFYQPVVRTISRKLCSFEALARWIDPEQGFISPGEFIPVLERTQQIHLLDTFVIRTACTRMRMAIDAGEIPVPVSVNLSRLDFTLCDIFATVSDIVTKHQIPHDFLYIEITESLMAEEGLGMLETIERFRSAGFQIWMDDFGSGYSSLNILKDVLFDEIKLDMHFLSNFDHRSKRIVASIIQMAKRIDIHTLAEGVETKEQFEYLHDIGCEKVQGYYFGKPMPYLDVMAHLAELKVEVERPAERAYYDSIGKVDFLSAVPFMGQEERVTLSSARKLNSIPLALAEARKDSLCVLFCNAAFEETVQDVGRIADLFQPELLRYSMPYDILPKRLINLMETTRTGEMGRLYFISHDEYYEVQAKCVAQSPDAYSILFSMSNLSKASESERTKQLDASLREVFSLYERITLIDDIADTVTPLYIGTREDLLTGRKGLAQLSTEYAENWIYPEDRAIYLEFADMTTLDRRLGPSGLESVSIVVRTLVEHGRYEWKEYTLFHLHDRTYVELIRNVHKEILEFTSHVGTTGHFEQGGESPLPDELVWRRLVSSDLINFFWKDQERRFVGASQGFLDYYEFPSLDFIVGKNDEDLGWHVQPDLYMNDEWRVINEGISTRNVPGNCMSHGENRDIFASKTPVYDENGAIRGLVGYFIDKGLLLANDLGGDDDKRRDRLTGLLNSRGIHEEARVFRDEYFLRGTDFVRIHVAIDDIAALNSQYGYDIGDKALVELGAALKRAFGVTATIGRFSGHQLVILKQIQEGEDLGALRLKAKDAASDIPKIDGIALTLYLSVGYCRFSEVESLEEQSKNAELRLLADSDEHSSITNRQQRASKIFNLYDDLPLSYSVYRVVLDEHGQVKDAYLFYINHAFEAGAGKKANELLGKGARELFPNLDEGWFDYARRAAYEGEIISDRFYWEPDGDVYIMTVSNVIRIGFCCFTYQKLGE